MAVLYFEETQRIRDNRWVWALAIAIFLAAIVPLLYGMYWQLGHGENFGDEPMSDEMLVLMFVIVFVCCAVGMTAFISLTLEVRVEDSGISYRCFPHVWKWRFISKEEIADYSFQKNVKWYQRAGLGYKSNRLRKLRSMRITGGVLMELHLKNKHRILVGTQNLEGLERAMKKMMLKTETI